MKTLGAENWSNEQFLTLLNLFLYALLSCNTEPPVEVAWIATYTNPKPVTLTSVIRVMKHKPDFFFIYMELLY